MAIPSLLPSDRAAARARRALLLDLARPRSPAARRRPRPRGAPCNSPSSSRAQPMSSSASTSRAGRGHDERHAHLAEAIVGHPDHRDTADRGVAEEQVLDLGWVRVEPADDEHVLLASDDAQAPALVDACRGRRCAATPRRRWCAAVASGRRGSRASRCSRAPAPRPPRRRARSVPSSSAMRISSPDARDRRWWRWSRSRRRVAVAVTVPAFGQPVAGDDQSRTAAPRASAGSGRRGCRPRR